MAKIIEQDWTKCLHKNANRLDERYYKELDQEIKREHTYVGRGKINRDIWESVGDIEDRNWKKKKLPTS